ncbi:hypothetical protein [Jatrophihabitans sp.]|uniref:DoxX family protein n=1 Tax=Jatrophihabitans sp. TaxID=1932789 RepID=UPI0030C72C45|nr:hypothetical protein [Jatrophihabitans sp.]
MPHVANTNRSARRLALLLAGSGALHFAVPKFYDPMIPTQLPGTPRAWTLGSGIVELAVGAAVAVPRTRRLAALAAFGLFVGVFPANVKMANDVAASAAPAPMKLATKARLPLQLPLLAWALRVRRNAV